MNAQVNQGWISLTDSCSYVHRGKRTVRKWMKMGLPYSRVGRTIMIKISDIDAWLEAHRERSVEPTLSELMRRIKDMKACAGS